MRIGFLITSRCNASCAHCTVSSGPHQSAALTAEQVTRMMDSAASVWRRERFDGERLHFGLSGGEPFTDFERLVTIVTHGANLGAIVTCVTNGYWASTDQRAREKLDRLKSAGLTQLALSVSTFHGVFVKLERVERALTIARQTGVGIALKCVIRKSDRGRTDGIEAWARSQPVDELEVFPVQPYLREGASLPEEEYIRRPGLPKGRCPLPSITVRENGHAYTCCMPGGFNEFLRLGDIFKDGFEEIYERFYLRGRQQVLRHRGPLHFARAVIAQGEGARLRSGYEGVCDLCAHIASDPQMSRIAAQAADAYGERELLRQVRLLQAKSAAPSRRPHAYPNNDNQGDSRVKHKNTEDQIV